MSAVEGIGTLIEQLLGLLGFRPVESLVVVAVQADEVSCVLRVGLADVVVAGDGVGRLAELAARNGADGVVAVFVSAEGASCPICEGQFADVTADLAGAMEGHGVRLSASVVVDRVEAGGRWHCVDRCGRSGVLNDPVVAPAVAQAVVEGRRHVRHS